MADVDSQLRLWSATASSNKPTGATSIGSGLDDNLRAVQAVVRQYLASPGSTIASSSTVDLSTADGHTIPISGSNTVTSYGTEVSGIEYLLTATGAHVIKNSSAIALPGAADITTAAGDYWLVESKGSGNWVVPFFGRASGAPMGPYSDTSTVISKSGSAAANIRFSASLVTAARVVTPPDYDIRLSNMPAGIIAPYAGSTVPTGWLPCDGTAVSRTTYAGLFAAISTTWGSGDGSTTFNVPDFRGRTLIGDGTGSGLTARTLAGSGGEETHTMTLSELVSHDHTVTSYANDVNGDIGRGSGGTSTSGIHTTSTGSSTPFNVMQPYKVVKYIISY